MFAFSSCPRYHSRVEHHDVARFPVVTILVGDGHPWRLWAEYRNRFQIARQKSVARHLGLFIDFVGARGAEFMPMESRGKFMQAFADALVMGTINKAEDPTGLWWLPLSGREARLTLNDVAAFGDWLEEKGYALALNPTRKATLEEQIVFWRRWSNVKGSSLLGHLKIKTRAAPQSLIAREAVVRTRAVPTHLVPKAFPEEMIATLLRDGFAARQPPLRWTTLRDQMILLLLHFGGKRISEVLQMWVGDVEENRKDPNRCIPWIPHPKDGLAEWIDPQTNTRKNITRQAYLQTKYGINPLTFETGRRHVGWKNPLLSEDKRMRVFWNDIAADRLFWTIYRQYLRLRPLIRRHPFLFITPRGDPMTVRAFEKVHKAAVQRVGMIAAKHLGTTPHGHRHAYGNMAESRKIDRKAIQVGMGHCSSLSQEIYKNRADDEIADQMIAATNRLERLSLRIVE